MLVAHGSRDTAADACMRSIARAVRAALPDVVVRVGYVDVRAPSVADAVAGLPGAVVVPAFLASGYHVRADLPAQLAAVPAGDPTGPAVGPPRAAARRVGVPAPGGGPAAGEPGRFSGDGAARWTVTPALGPDPLLVAAAVDWLARAGLRRGDVVVLAAAGSADPAALGEVGQAGRLLGAALDRRVRVGFAAGAAPRVDALVAGLRAAGGRRVAVASWLLAPGVFQGRLAASGADVVAAPLGAHPAVVEAIVSRYRTSEPRRGSRVPQTAVWLRGAVSAAG